MCLVVASGDNQKNQGLRFHGFGIRRVLLIIALPLMA